MSIRQLIEQQAQGRPIAFVFDLDETIIDTSPFHRQLGINAAILLEQNSPHTIFECNDLVKKYINETNYVREAFRDNHGIDFKTTLNAVYNPKTLNRNAIPSRADLLSVLTYADFPTYIFTNAPSIFSHMNVHEAGLSSAFNRVVSTDNIDYFKKDNIEAYIKFEQLVGISSKTHCIYFVDNSLENLRHANEAGWNCIHTSEFTDAPELYPDYVRFSIDNLVEFVNALNGETTHDQDTTRSCQSSPRPAGISSRI